MEEVGACYYILLLLFAISQADELTSEKPKTIDIPSGDPKRCYVVLNDKNLIRYESLPGNGWDNLKNKDAGIVVNFNYSKCRTTDDGRYIIPDTVYTVPIKSSKVETYAELFDHWSNYTSTTSSSINIGAGLTLAHFGISGKFSHEAESIKSHQVNDKAITTRVQVRYVRYTAKLQPDTPLHPTFKARLLSIAAHLQLNRTNMATYESQLLVRDFGTHVVTSVDAGAALVQVDEIKSTFSRDYSFSKSKITASASASFFSVFKIGASYEHETTKEMINQYLGNRSHSRVETYGGPVFKPINFSLNDWGAEIGDDLVALDRSGDPLYFLITPYSLPELPTSAVYKLIKSVKTAIEIYYKFNIYRGCTNPDSPNFSFQANVDDGTCKAPYTNLTFGGVYQTCTRTGQLSQNLCSGLDQKNPLTGDYSCPEDYEPVMLQESTRSASESVHKCHRCWLFAHCCHDETRQGSAQYRAYWCVARGSVRQQSGFLFGGLYTSTVSNPLTLTKDCPLYFYPLKLGNDMKVCVSDDYELGFEYAVPFGGFYSCRSGNPLMLGNNSEKLLKSGPSLRAYLQKSGAGHWPKGCPSGYSQHLATVENSCEINYCVVADAFSPHGLPPLRQPPYMDIPAEGFEDSLSYSISEDGLTWDIIEPSESDGPARSTGPNSKSSDSSQSSDDTGLSKGAVAGISIVATIACVVLASIAFLKYRQHRSLYRPLTMSTAAGRERTIQSANRVQYGTQNTNVPEVLVEP